MMSSPFVATWSCTWSSTSGRFCSAWDSLLGTPTDCLKGASWIGICWMYGAPNSMMFYCCLSIRPSVSCYLCIFFLFILLWLDIYLVNSLIQNPEHGCHRSFCGWRRAWYREGSTLRVHRGSTPHTCPTHFFICRVLLSLGVPFANNWQACLLNSVRHSEELNTRRRLWESGHSWWWVGGSGS